jgi:hypothetical protein
MYKTRYIQRINLPEVPQAILDSLPRDFSLYKKKVTYDTANWTDEFNTELDKWAKEHVSQDIYFALQIMTGDVVKHTDFGTQIKFIYLLQPGGENVYTRFWSDDHSTLLDEYLLPCNQWHILKADSVHSVEGVEPGATRWSITGKIF